jgi:serine/threonine protein kinase
MPAPATADEFVDLIRKSGVVDESKLSAYLKQLQSNSDLPREMNKFAGLFVRDGLLTFFQAEQFLLGKWKRFTIGKYKVLERLGSGGMGQVFLCEHKLMRRKVAVKVLPTSKAEDPSSLERFYREARAVAALDHPNIVRAYDIDQDDNLHFLVMEYVDGASLQEVIKKHGPMDVTRACHYMYWSAIGLQHAHEAGLIHRDIKPGNILIDRQGTVKILDLGLARFFNDDEDLLTKKYDENVLGTADYLAPEQALDSHSVDGRADIYSLGATFYFMLVGSQPFVDGTVAQKLIWHQTRSPKSIREQRPEVPEGIIQIVEKMMAKDPAQRYQTPAELAEALAPWVQTPIGPPPDKEMPQLSAAAQAVGGGPVSTTAVRQMPQLPKPGGGSGTRGSSGSDIPLVPTPDSGTRRGPPAKPRSTTTPAVVSDSEETTRRNTPAPGVESLPSDAPPVWESLSADTGNAARDRTERQSPSKSKSKKAPKVEPLEERKPARARKEPACAKSSGLLLMIGGLALVAAGAGFAVYWFVFRTPSKQETNQGGGAANGRLTVAKSGGNFTSVREALGKANSGDHIVILDPTWEEDLTVATGQGNGVTIEGAEGKDVIWKLNKTSQRAITLLSPEGLKIRNLRFEGDAQEVFPGTPISVTGKVAGLVLEDLTIRNFKDAGIQFRDCMGSDASPAVVQRVRVVSSAKSPANAGVAFSASVTRSGGQTVARVNESITVRDCRLEGPFSGGAIEIDGSTNRIEIKNNRIWQCDSGINFKKAEQGYAYRARIVGNTFSNVGVGIHFKNAGFIAQQVNTPPFVEVEQNYFANVGQIVKSDDNASFPFRLVANNARNSATNEGAPNISAFVQDETLPTDPNSPQFLRYGKSSKLNSVGPNGKPVGVPPE